MASSWSLFTQLFTKYYGTIEVNRIDTEELRFRLYFLDLNKNKFGVVKRQIVAQTNM